MIVADQSAVIAFLADPASYGAAGGTVERVTTHCSLIFLVGERAFKLKRAVKYSYLDYSTVALRERFCRAELAINRRTAPELYVAVRAVTRDASGALAFDGAGEVLDWVVEMRRFDESTLFDRLAEAGKLDGDILRRLADAIAAFHKDAAAAMPDHGGAAAMARTIAMNDENLRLAAPPLERAAIDELRAAMAARLARAAPLLEQRRTGGKVRRCHGDLHLGNVCLVEGRPTLFDAIEFNDDFAGIDVLYDTAFLLMDLTARRLPGLAAIVFNRYLDRTGDDEGLPALPLFLSARAGVRAHVLGTLARTAGGDGARAGERATAYLRLAITLLASHPPRLIAIGGLSGSGKSSVAQALAGDFLPAPGARIIRSDVVRKRLAGVAAETPLPRESYDVASAARVYAASREAARHALTAGCSVILDAAFLRAEERAAAAEVARDLAIPFTGLWLEAPAAILAQRIECRRNDVSDADRGVLAQQMGYELGIIDWHRVDAAGDLAGTTTRARQALSATAALGRH